MAFNANTAINNSVQTSINNIFQSATSNCQGSCNQFQGDINFIVSGSTTGDLKLTQECAANALCVMRTNLDTIATQQLANKQAAESGAVGSSTGGLLGWLGLGISVNSSINASKQTLQNTTTQIINNNCSSSVNQVQQNINFLITDNSQVGNVELSQSGNATANCAITSAASATITQTASNDQTASAFSGSVVATIIAGIVVALLLLWLLMGSGKKEEGTEGTDGKTGEKGKPAATKKVATTTIPTKYGNFQVPSQIQIPQIRR